MQNSKRTASRQQTSNRQRIANTPGLGGPNIEFTTEGDGQQTCNRKCVGVGDQACCALGEVLLSYLLLDSQQQRGAPLVKARHAVELRYVTCEGVRVGVFDGLGEV